MTIDSYAPCPCGSGKKIKFCKCIDQPHEYEKIARLLEGGQELAALERVNQLLSKTPNTAWLLAIKGEVSLSLNELDSFRETAQRFLKLKPDNPLALTMCAISTLLGQEPIENATRLLLDGLAESREGLPGLAMSAMQLLCEFLRRSPLAPMRFFWSRLLSEIREKAEAEPIPDRLPLDNLVSMSMPLVLPNPPGSPWMERANEVSALISGFRYAQAETKLRAILRDYPEQAGPLSQLLYVQTVLLDQDGACTTARKLATLRDVSEQDRDYFAALGLEIEKHQMGLRAPSLVRYCEIQSDEAAREALSKLGFADAVPDEAAAELKSFLSASVGDEVPAKTIFGLESSLTLSSGKTIQCSCGTVALFGRQTDKPARALVLIYNMPGSDKMMEGVVAAIQPVADLADPQAPRLINYQEVLDRPRYKKDEKDIGHPLSSQEESEALTYDVLNYKWPILGNQSLLQAIEDEPKRATVRAILTHFEGFHHVITEVGTIDKIYQTLGFERPTFNVGDNEGRLQVRILLELVRIDATQLVDKRLFELFGICIQIGVISGAFRLAKELLNRKDSQPPPFLYIEALSLMSEQTRDLGEAIQLMEKLETAMAAQKLPVGEVIMRRFALLNNLGREQEAGELLGRSFKTYPKDPHLASVWRYIYQQMQRDGRDSSVNETELLSRMATRRAEPESDSGLVLPGNQSSEPGKSKLWLPGS